MFRFLIAPKFWRDKNSRLVKFLNPLAHVYSYISRAKYNNVTPMRADVPVICVGNVVLGGAGKTPAVELVCDILKKFSKNPHILTAGYGGYLKNVVRVDTTLHSYLQVGDEALLSARVAPTWIGRNRINSSRAATIAGADVLVMDDGFQNNSLEKDLKILVVDSKQCFGNEHLFPAGPLREGVESGILKSDVVLIIGEPNEDLENRIREVSKTIPICRAVMKPSVPEVPKNKVIGFCGLGFPDKFKKTIVECGFELADFIVFPDHHPYTITELQKLISTAKNVDASLVTTMKDFVKIPEVFKSEISVIGIKLVCEDETFEQQILQKLS